MLKIFFNQPPTAWDREGPKRPGTKETKLLGGKHQRPGDKKKYKIPGNNMEDVRQVFVCTCF